MSVLTIAGIEVVTKYHKEWEETFIHPACESGEFSLAEFDKVTDELLALGYGLTGGHECYVSVAGRIKWINA